MHYNLNQRLKPKKHVPWKKVLIICIVLLLAIAVYVVMFHTGNDAPAPVKPRPPQ
jgi:membrane protein YdbS with pleckstrin-like domain